MRHPPIEQLRAFAAGESSPGRRRRTAAHLAACGSCREELAWIRGVRAVAAETVALPAPAGGWERIEGRLAAGEVVLLPDGDEVQPRRLARIPALRAALLVLGFAGVASATVPGSPVRGWIERVLPAPRATAPAADRQPAVADSPGDADPGEAEGAESPVTPARLLVPLVDGALSIRIERSDPGLRIRVRLGDDPDLLVDASDGAASGRFRAAAGRLAIEEAGPGDVVIGIPTEAVRVTLEVDGRPYLIKEGGRLRILAPVVDTAGTEFVFSPGPGAGAGRP